MLFSIGMLFIWIYLGDKEPIPAKQTKTEGSKEMTKKERIHKLFDDILLVTLDPNSFKDSVNINPLLSGGLEKFPLDTLKNKKAKVYVERLKELKKRNVDTLESQNRDSVFTSQLNTFFKDSIYKDYHNSQRSSIDSTKVDSSYYPNKINEIKALMWDTSVELNNLEEEPKPTYQQILEKIWLLVLLIVSIAVNIFQWIRQKIKDRQSKKLEEEQVEESRQDDVVEKAFDNELDTIEETETKQHAVETVPVEEEPKPKKLSSEKVGLLIKDKYTKHVQSVKSNYHQDCLEIITSEGEEEYTIKIKELTKKEYENEQEVFNALKPLLNQHKAFLKKQLDNCVSREQVKLRIQERINVERFLQSINTKLLSNDDIKSQIEIAFQNAFVDLPPTYTKSELEDKIIEIGSGISKALKKKETEKLTCYYPFSDTKGVLHENKKSSQETKESAIKLMIDPDNLKKARFTLVYDNKPVMKAGIMTYDKILMPICSIQKEGFNRMGTRIVQNGGDGVMEFENGAWKVKEKLLIKVL